MSTELKILNKSLVAPFYKQNAGLFAFFIFIMFGVVGRANGVGLLEYHYSLIQAIMTNIPFLLFTLGAWFLYALKCAQFITDTLGKKEYTFLNILTLKKPVYTFWKMFVVQTMLLLPILLYVLISVWIGFLHSWWMHVIIILLFSLFLIFAGSWWNQHVLYRPGKQFLQMSRNLYPDSANSFYWLFLIRYIWNSRKTLFLVIKIVNCLVLYGLFRDLSGDHPDLRMLILFYSFALLGHGVLIYIIRAMEESDLRFYRSLPFSLLHRFLQYALFYLVLFIPEILVVISLTPNHIPFGDAIFLVFFGYGIIQLLNSLLIIRFFKPSDYLKILSGIFLIIFISILTGIFQGLCVGLFFLSPYIFFRSYYRFEKKESA
jgi:hypothetical protein